MKKRFWVSGLAVFGLVVATIGLATFVEDPENPGSSHMVIENPGGGQTCTCPMVFAPVVCDKGDDRKAYSNACFAGCDGATNCAQVVWQGR